jgi:hypothetical protein
MKKATITITYDEEKLAAIQLFLAQKNLDLDKELASFMEQLYRKNVPKNVQEYLELKDCIVPEKPAKTHGQTRTEQDAG